MKTIVPKRVNACQLAARNPRRGLSAPTPQWEHRMGGQQSVSRAEFPYYFVTVRVRAFVPIDNVIGGLVAEDFHIGSLGKATQTIVTLQVLFPNWRPSARVTAGSQHYSVPFCMYLLHYYRLNQTKARYGCLLP